jgi:hypothetical protein
VGRFLATRCAESASVKPAAEAPYKPDRGLIRD